MSADQVVFTCCLAEHNDKPCLLYGAIVYDDARASQATIVYLDDIKTVLGNEVKYIPKDLLEKHRAQQEEDQNETSKFDWEQVMKELGL